MPRYLLKKCQGHRTDIGELKSRIPQIQRLCQYQKQCGTAIGIQPVFPAVQNRLKRGNRTDQSRAQCRRGTAGQKSIDPYDREAADGGSPPEGQPQQDTLYHREDQCHMHARDRKNMRDAGHPEIIPDLSVQFGIFSRKDRGGKARFSLRKDFPQDLSDPSPEHRKRKTCSPRSPDLCYLTCIVDPLDLPGRFTVPFAGISEIADPDDLQLSLKDLSCFCGLRQIDSGSARKPRRRDHTGIAIFRPFCTLDSTDGIKSDGFRHTCIHDPAGIFPQHSGKKDQSEDSAVNRSTADPAFLHITQKQPDSGSSDASGAQPSCRGRQNISGQYTGAGCPKQRESRPAQYDLPHVSRIACKPGLCSNYGVSI